MLSDSWGFELFAFCIQYQLNLVGFAIFLSKTKNVIKAAFFILQIFLHIKLITPVL